MTVLLETLHVLDDTLGLKGRSNAFGPQTPLLGALPELDSMAVVSLISALEAHFGVTLPDDEIDGSVFGTVGALADFVERQVEEQSSPPA